MTAPNVGIPRDEDYDDATELSDEEFDLSELDETGGDAEEDHLEQERPAAPKKGAPPATEQGGTPRDERGRFAPRGIQEAPAGEEPAHADETPGAEGAPAGGEGPPAPEENPTFSFRGAKQDWQIEGSQVSKDWIHIPRSFEPDFRALLADAIEHRTSFRQRLGDAQQIRQKQEAFFKTAKVESYEDAITLVEGARSFMENFAVLVQKGPDAIAEWLDGFERNLPKLNATALDRQRKRLIELAKAGKLIEEEGGGAGGLVDDQGDLPTLTDEHYAQLRHEVPQVLRGLRDTDPELMKLLSDDDLQVLAEDVGEVIERVVAIAPHDAPEYGLDRGDIYYDKALLLGKLRRFAKAVSAKRQHVEEATRAEAQNRARSGGAGSTPRTPAPPTVSARGRETGRVEIPLLPKTREEMEEWDGLDINTQLASRDQGKRSTGKGIWPSRQKA